LGKHKVPTLRNVDLRPFNGLVKAYGHNGYFKSLKAIVHFYNTPMSTARAPAAFAGPLNAADVSRIAEFRRLLDRHEFAGEAVPAALGAALPIGKFHYRDDLPVYLRRLAARTPINTLIKLFVLDQPIDDALVRDAIAPLDVEDLGRLGLVEDDAHGVRATVRLSGYAGLVLAHDRPTTQPCFFGVSLRTRPALLSVSR
jgi:hypothetical protein